MKSIRLGNLTLLAAAASLLAACATRTASPPAYHVEPALSESTPTPVVVAVTPTPAVEVVAAEVVAEPTSEATPEPTLQLPAPSVWWIRVPDENRPDEDTLALLLHPRGEGRVMLRKVSKDRAVDDTLDWLESNLRSFEVQDQAASGAGVPHEELSFAGWQGQRAIAGRAGVYLAEDAAYAVVATCDKHFIDTYKADFAKVLSEFRPQPQ